MKMTSKTYYSNLIEKTGQCHDLKNTKPDIYKEFVELLEYHPKQKARDMINLKIEKSKWNNYQLVIVNSNGTEDSISWAQCITNKRSGKVREDTPFDDLTKVMRSSISYQILDFKKTFNYQFKCELCGNKGTDSEMFHVDHIVEFRKLRDIFLSNRSEFPNEFDWNKGSVSFKSIDSVFESDWRLFHQKHSKLRVLCRKCNLSRK